MVVDQAMDHRRITVRGDIGHFEVRAMDKHGERIKRAQHGFSVRSFRWVSELRSGFY